MPIVCTDKITFSNMFDPNTNLDYYNTSIDKNADRDIVEHFKNIWPLNEWYTIGYFNEEQISNINIHWMKFSPPNPLNYNILALLYFFIMIIGLSGNLLVILMYFRTKSLRNPANTLVVNLAISDGLMMSKMPVFIYNCIHRGPVLGDLACTIYGFIGGLSGTVSIITLTTISLDRYIVIKYPLSIRSSGIRIKLLLICSWIYGSIFSVIPILNVGIGRYQYEGYLISCSYDYLTTNQKTKKFIIFFFIAAYVVPLIAITFCYMKIVQVVLGRSWNPSDRKESVKHMKEKDQRKQEIKLAIIVLIIICLWFFSWTPYAIISLLGVFNQNHLITPIWSMIPALFCKTASAIDPYVYALSHPKYRAEIAKLVNLSDRNKTIKKMCSADTAAQKTTQAKSNTSKQWRKEVDDDDNDGVEEELIEIRMDMIKRTDNNLTGLTISTTEFINRQMTLNEQQIFIHNNSRTRFTTNDSSEYNIISRF